MNDQSCFIRFSRPTHVELRPDLKFSDKREYGFWYHFALGMYYRYPLCCVLGYSLRRIFHFPSFYSCGKHIYKLKYEPCFFHALINRKKRYIDNTPPFTPNKVVYGCMICWNEWGTIEELMKHNHRECAKSVLLTLFWTINFIFLGKIQKMETKWQQNKGERI